MFDFISKYLTVFRLPRVGILDVLEIIILAFLLYQVMKWMKNTRAWAVVKGLAVILVFMAIAEILDMTTIIWIGKSLFTLGAVAIIVALQPEIRRLIEDLGKNNLLTTLILLGDMKAFIVLKDGVEDTPEVRASIEEHCRRHIAKYAMPRLWEYRDSLPTTLVGKVAYTKLQ